VFTSPKVIDDRGRRVPLVRRSDIGEGLSAFKRGELRSRIPVDRLRIVVILCALVAGLATARVGWLAITGQPFLPKGGWSLSGSPGLMLLWVLVLGVNILRTDSRLDYTERVVAPCLKWGVCASCGYSLRDALEQDDGCVVCSECGAAWKRAKVGSA
jgi:hypothetical protein